MKQNDDPSEKRNLTQKMRKNKWDKKFLNPLHLSLLHHLEKETLTEEDGLVQLTSLYWLV
jgi:hypothetical protein